MYVGPGPFVNFVNINTNTLYVLIKPLPNLSESDNGKMLCHVLKVYLPLNYVASVKSIDIGM